MFLIININFDSGYIYTCFVWPIRLYDDDDEFMSTEQQNFLFFDFCHKQKNHSMDRNGHILGYYKYWHLLLPISIIINKQSEQIIFIDYWLWKAKYWMMERKKEKKIKLQKKNKQVFVYTHTHTNTKVESSHHHHYRKVCVENFFFCFYFIQMKWNEMKKN